jgi:hypothetical protein
VGGAAGEGGAEGGGVTRERDLQNTIRLAASEAGLTLWRNNVGTGWAGDATRLPDGSVLIRNPRPLHAGLCVGSSDLIGYRPLVITPEHLGTTLAQFAAIEIKADRGRERPEQRHFREVVTAAGGFAIVARSAGEIPPAMTVPAAEIPA